MAGKTLAVAAVLAGAFGVGYFANNMPRAATAFGLNSQCRIKGNISINSGAHIYHVPGQEYYDETVISPRYGERWFCSEAEARAAGWRRAGR